MSNYSDPDNTIELMNKLKNCPTLGDVKSLMDEIYPGLFITVLKEFSNDYPSLTINWHDLCRTIPTSPKEILILDNYPNDCVLIKRFSECFTTAGFVVRRKTEIVPCEKCLKGLPSFQLYQILRQQNSTMIPITWSNKCSTCK